MVIVCIHDELLDVELCEGLDALNMLNSYNRLDNSKFCVYTMQSVAQSVGQRGWPTGWTTDCIVYTGFFVPRRCRFQLTTSIVVNVYTSALVAFFACAEILRFVIFLFRRITC
jgi:hypothetical protein